MTDSERTAPTVAEAITGGDTRKALEALRDRLAYELDTPGVSPASVAALTKQLTVVLTTLAELPGAKEGSTVDDLARARNARRAGAALPAGAAAGVKRGAGGDRARS